MDDVFASAFPKRRRFRIQLLGEDLRQPVKRPVVVQELPNEGGGAAEALGLFLEDRGLLRREADGLGEVIVTGRGFGHGGTPYWGRPDGFVNLDERCRRRCRTSSVFEG